MAKQDRSLSSVVGPEVYGHWVDVLKRLVPLGRTHRLSVVIAGMLEYTRAVAENHETGEVEGSAAYDLLGAVEHPEQAHSLISDLVTRLFRDAGVEWKRKSRRGQSYSIARDAIEQYIHWEGMSWE